MDGCSCATRDGDPFRVLFCGHDMLFGFLFTKEELEQKQAGSGSFYVFNCGREEVPQMLKEGVDVVVPLMTALTREILMDSSHRLKLIIQFGAGIEGIDVAAATERGIYVANIPTDSTPNAVSCAEMAIMLTLLTLRHPHTMADSVRNRRLGVPLGSTLSNKNVLIIGFGGIAKALIPRLAPFGVSLAVLRRSNLWALNGDARMEGKQNDDTEILGSCFRSHVDGEVESLVQSKGCWPHDAPRLAADADVVIVTCKQSPETMGLINEIFLSHCKDGVRIVNVARGGILDYDATLRGLNSGKIGAMGLDVQFWEPFDPDDPIAQHPQVFLTPHVAGVTEESCELFASLSYPTVGPMKGEVHCDDCGESLRM